MMVPMPQPGSRTVASWGTPRCLSALSMARPKLPPSCVFIAAGDRIRNERQSHHAKSGEAGERLTFVGGRRTLGLFDGLRRADHVKDVAGLRFVATEGNSDVLKCACGLNGCRRRG
jgi:hypothetical protein